jgi:hypothetical protein
MEIGKTKLIIILLILVLIIPAFLGLLFGGAARIGSMELGIFTFGIPVLIAYLGLKSLKRIIWLNIITSVSLIIVAGVFTYEMRFSQLLFVSLVLFAFVMLLINLISIFKFWSEYDFAAFIPIIISILTIPLAFSSLKAGRWTNIYVFKNRLPQYQAAVKMIENQIGNEPLYLLGKDIPPQYRKLAISIHAERENSVLGVTFTWGVGFPLKHTAYAYISNGQLPEKGTYLSKNWYYWERINDHWFYVGD